MANILNSVASLAQQCIGLLRFQEFDTSTQEGRSRERYRRVALTALSSAGARGVSVVTLLITVPLTLNYLGPERYGLWMTISSVITMMGFADLGMGLGVMNAVAEAHGRNDRQAAISYVSSGFFLLCAMAMLIGVGFAVVYPLIPWQRLFNVQSPQAIREAGPALAVFMACFAMGLPLGVVQRVQWGYQEGFFNNLWDSAGKVLGLLGLLLVIYLQAGLGWLVLALAGAPILAAFLNSIVLFGLRLPWLRPRLRNCQGAAAQRIVGTGLFFFMHLMSLTVIYAMDNLIISQFLGPEAVPQYAIPYQMFSITLVIFNAIIAPLWPAYVEAIARRDMAWVKKTLKRSLVFIVLIIGSVSCVLVLFGNQFLKVWVGPQLSPPFMLKLGLGFWMIFLAIGTAFSMVLHAGNIFKFQLIFISLTVIFALFLKCLFTYLFAISGIIWGTILVYVSFILLPYGIYLQKYFFRRDYQESTI